MGFSLIVATCGRSKELNKLFSSLLEQTYKNFEVIVIDQNRDSLIDSCVLNYKNKGLRINHIKIGQMNLSHARNVGLKYVEEEIVAFPDDDCWYDPDTLEKVMLRFNLMPDTPVIFGNWVEKKLPHKEHFVLRKDWFQLNHVASSITIFIKRDLFQLVGAFDTRFGVGQYIGAGEETDLIFRVFLNGQKIFYDPLITLHHNVNHNKLSLKQIRLRQRANGALYIKYKLPFYVLLRGFIAPWFKNLNAIKSFMVVLGRLEGLFFYLRNADNRNW